MTETSPGRASTRRSSTSGKAAASEPADAPPTTAPAAEVEKAAVVPTQRGDGRTAPADRTPMTLTIRLPFFTATFTGPGSAPPAGAPLAPAVPGRRDPGGMLEKMAFYGGVAAAGALGALEWPVAAAVAAGTWVAQHTPPPAGLLRGNTSPAEARKPAEPEPIAVTSDS